MDTNPTYTEIGVHTLDKRAVRVTFPAPVDVWKRLIAADSEALAFQSPAWMKAITATGAFEDDSRLYEFPDGRLAVLPLARRAGIPTWMATAGSMPYSWGMGGLVGADANLRVEEISAVFADLMRRPGLSVSIRPNPIHAALWQAARPRGVVALNRMAHVIDLSEGFDQVWKQFTGEARTAVRKAERSGLEVTLDTTGEHIEHFYRLFLLSVDRWAEQQHEPRQLSRWRAQLRDPIGKFHAIAKTRGAGFNLWTAWKDGQPVASIMVLLGRNASYTRGVMDKDLAGPTRANQLLHRLAIEQACKAGCLRYHMGETGSSSSLARFKAQFGAKPIDYAEYYVEKLPITYLDQNIRTLVKKTIGFKDAE